jgi:hypothetical protein
LKIVLFKKQLLKHATATFILLAISTFTYTSWAQTGNAVSGRIVSKADPLGLPGANVVALTSADSAIVRGTTTGISGNFTLANLASGAYILRVSFVGFNDTYRNFSIESSSVDLGIITPTESAVSLKGVEVTENIHQSVQKGDTTQFNADAFKTNPDADSEDLLRKMPGVKSENGTIEVQGESVKQILVDGKPFFGDDPRAALKNLPANAVDKVEVFNFRSDQSLFTGFDDGTEGKTINIITKPEFRNGTFGRIYAGYGDQDRYKAGGNLNFFNNDRRITLLFQSNNINEQNFAADDLSGVLGASGGSSSGRPGGRGRGGRMGGDSNLSEFLVDQRNGISQVYAAGINYADKWGKKTKVTGSYFFNLSENVTESSLFREFTLAASEGLIYNQSDIGSSTNLNHRFNMRFETTLDSNNSFVIRPRLTYQSSTGTNSFLGENKGDSIINSTQSVFDSEFEGLNFSSSILYRHKFKKKGRTFSIDLTPSYNSNSGENKLRSENIFFEEIITADSIDQQAFLNQVGYGVNNAIAFTESLSEKSMLQFNLRSNYSFNDSEKETFRYSAFSGEYDIRDTLLTNIFNTTYHTQSFGPEYRYNDKKFQLTLGVSYQWAELKSNQEFPTDFAVSEEFNAILPSIRFNYSFTDKKRFRLNYRTANNPPTAQQLQGVVNNSNPVRLTTGNPDLEQNYEHRVFMHYNASNVAKSSTFFLGGGFTFTNNYIGNSTIVALSDTLINNEIFLSRGAQLVKPVNLDGFFSLRSFSSYGFPVKVLKSNFNIDASFRYSRTPGLINGEINWSNTPSANFGFTLGSNISKEVDFTISTSAGYNLVFNSLQSDLNNNYYTQNSRVALNWMIWRGLVFSTDVNHQYLDGASEGFSQNFLLVNAGVGYKFLKDRKAEIRLTAFDLLNANQSAQRSISDVYVEDTRTNVLQRFFMINFTYNIRNFKDGK